MALRELFAVFGVDFDAKALNEGASAVEGTFSQIQKLGQLVTAAWFTHGIYEFAAGVADFADELTDTGAAVGMNARELLAWRTTASSVGVGAEQLRAVFGAFARNVDAANTGNADTRKAFDDLGVSISQTGDDARSTSAILANTLTEIAQIEDPTARAALAMRLLGEQGARLLPAFEGGSQGLEDMQVVIEELFGGDLEEAARQADELERQTALWDLSLQALKTTIGLELLPNVTDMVRKSADAIRGFQELTKGTHVVELALGILGAAGAAAGLRMLIPFLPAIGMFLLVAAAIGIVVLVVDDLIALFTGGRSVIGEFIDSMLGVGSAQNAVWNAKAAWGELNAVITDTNNALGVFLGTSDRLTTTSNFSRGLVVIWGEIIMKIERAKAALEELGGTVADVLDPTRVANRRVGLRQSTASAAVQDRAPIRIARELTATVQNMQPAAARASVATTAGGGRVEVRQQTPTTINLYGVGDPEATAAIVDERIERRRDADMQDVRNALVQTAD
jgi:uncharacterized protein with GYD domain